MNDLFDITGKIALVTGSGRGIGFTLAEGLAKAGSKVILNDIDGERLDHAVSQLRQGGFAADGVVFDITDEEQVQGAVDDLQQRIGSIDILVNNAGIQIRGPLEDFNLEDWQRIISINLTGAFIVAKSVVKRMIEANAGKIINICSIQSELARPTIAPYTASKGGIRNLTRGMATDWGKYNIQSNGIAPGYFKTAMTEKLYQDKEFDAWLRGRTPANRWGEPEELVGTLIYLASNASNYVNGQILYIDGGMSACV